MAQNNFISRIAGYCRISCTKARRLLFVVFPPLEYIFDKWTHKKLLSKFQEIDRINFGCGRDLMEGWVNIALFAEEIVPYGVFVRREKGILLLHFDAKKEFPFPDNQIQYLYASHFIEHLDFLEGLAFLSRCYRVMRRGGLIRLVCPDLELWVKKYIESDTDFFNTYKDLYYSEININYIPIKTKGEIFSSQVCGFGHKWCYDFESIKDVMERIGFANVSIKSPSESLMPDIKEIESKNRGRAFESIYVESEKP
jgi:predicted SAM-dependent methyltransferase